MKKIAIYVRVSTNKQDSTNQLIELRNLANRLNYEIVQEYTDNGISGTKGREDRPGLDLLLNHAGQRKFEQVLDNGLINFINLDSEIEFFLREQEIQEPIIKFINEKFDQETVFLFQPTIT